LACSFPFWICPCLVLGGVYYWLHAMSWALFLFYFMEKFKECWL
jgi:hypothetical protein